MKKLILIIIFLYIIQLSATQVEFIVQEMPKEPKNLTIYLAGNFNSWNPGHNDYKLQKVNDSHLITLDLPQGTEIEYKFTQGSWDTVEKGESYQEISNRTLTVPIEDVSIKHIIKNWRNTAMETNSLKSTITGNVIKYNNFYMPQLNRKRDLYIYLPPDYNTSSRRYPVIYMHDGQNLFDEATSFVGEWQIDETLERFYKEAKFNGAIVIGICNHKLKRQDEYSPWICQRFQENSGGEGDEYVDFLVETLKPWVDTNYRTLSDSEHTMLAGSSLGGLITLYAGCKYPWIYGKLGIFSPAFWFADPQIKDYLKSHPILPQTRVYMDVGTTEGSPRAKQIAYVEDAKKMAELLISSGLPEDNLWLVIEENGRHNEGAWARRFPAALLWLFEKE